MVSRGMLAFASVRARRSFVLLWSALFVFSLLLQYATFARPQGALGASGLKAGTVQGFEVDGDPLSGNGAANQGSIPPGLIDGSNPLANGDDWIKGASGNGVVDPPNPPNSVLIADPANSSSDDIFQGGAKELDTCTWGYTTGNVTAKDDFRHVMAYAKFVGNSAFFFMGAERIVNNGDTHIDFELNKLPFTTFPGDPGVSKPNRSVGDLIVALEFSDGGSNPEVTVWRVKKVTDCKKAKGGQVAGQEVEVEDITATAAVHSATNFSNLAPITWPGDTTATTLESFFFAEAAIDLAALGIQTSCPGLSAGSIRSRAGGDINSSQLKDTVAPFPIDLNNCGTVTIVKDAIPNDPQDFSFSGSFGSFSLDDDADGTLPDRRTFTQVAPGQYAVTEGAVDGWSLTGLTCSDANSSGDLAARTATINVEPNEDVTCTFTNTKLAKLVVEKQTSPDGASGSFSFSGAVSGSIGDGGTIASGFLTPGTYTVTEADPAPPFDLGAIVCDDQNSSGDVATRTATFRLDPGETVTCTFTNVERGTITIIKDAIPNDPQDFSFTGDLGSFSLDDDGSEVGTPSMMTFEDVRPGEYTVTEGDVAGWDLTDVSCNGTLGSSGSRSGSSAEISLTPGGSVTCTFTNTKRGTIIVEKQTNPDGDPATFDFSGDVSGSLGDGDQASASVAPGTYSVSETVPAGWDLTSIACDDTDSTGDVASATATFHVSPGETVTCTFTNTKRGTIIVDKVTDPSADPQSFAFDLSGGPDSVAESFSLTDEAAPHESSNLKPGTYSVSETPVAGWDLTSAVCSDGSDPSAIDLAPGETVTCTFTNTKRGTIIVEKQTNPDGATDTFTFEGDASGSIADGGQIVVSDLVPGTYTSTEADPGSNWDLGAIVCDDQNSSGDVATRTATFRLDPGETVTCTFTNVQRGTITIIKNAVPNDPQDFSFTQTIDESGGFMLDDDADPTLSNTKTFENVLAGDYSVTESGVGGWDLTGVECTTSGGSTATRDGQSVDIHLTEGGSVTCVFENTKRGSITIVKDAIPNDPQDFSFTGDLGSFSLDDDADPTLSNSFTASNLVPGTYSVSETPVAGWDLTSAVCSDESDPAEIALGPGETVTCTFTNERPSISVTKRAGDAADGATFTTLAGPVTYTYVVTNTGPVALENVTVTDDNGTPADPSDDFAATCPKTTLDPGESMTCSKTVTVTADRTNTATARGLSAQGTEVSDADTAVVAIRHPETGIAKSHDDVDGVVGPGQVVTYTIAVQVVEGPVTNPVVTDTLPAGQTYVSGSQSSSPAASSFSVSGDGRTLTWTFASLPTGNPAATVSYQVAIDANAPTGVQTNVAELCVSELEACKTDEATVRVPALVIEKAFTGNSEGTDPALGVPRAAEGDTLTYTLTYTLTNGPVTGAVITDTLPAGLSYVEGSAAGNDEFSFTSFDASSRTLRWDATTATKSGSVTYQVVVAAGAAALAQPLVNSAVIDSNETNPDQDAASVAVAPPPAAETATPRVTPPATDTADLPAGNPGSMLMIALLIIAAIALLVGLLTPAPAKATRRNRRP